MTTASQMKKIAEPLLQKYPDLAWIGRTIILKPVTHIARGIIMDSSAGKTGFNPRWGATYLFRERTSLSFHWNIQFPYRPIGIWEIDHPDHQSAFIEIAESEALPRLREMNSFESFLNFTECSEINYSWTALPLARVIIQAALGKVSEAQKSVEVLREANPTAAVQPYPLFNDILEHLWPALIKNDRPAIAQVLHHWEQKTVTACKLTAYWQPTPFPIEETA
ncbi:hypothetical protein [Azorhizobium caulinodans]|uniref:hypothetical protein n=1 Tax=Azorhizobium caulinodans TaxID=7 RepID=UPI002FBF0793